MHLQEVVGLVLFVLLQHFTVFHFLPQVQVLRGGRLGCLLNIVEDGAHALTDQELDAHGQILLDVIVGGHQLHKVVF